MIPAVHNWTDFFFMPVTYVASKFKTRAKTTFCKSVHWISGYQGYQRDIRGVINGYQEKID